MAEIFAYLIARYGLSFTIHLDLEAEVVGDHLIEIDQGIDAIDILQLDQLLRGLTEGMRLEAPDGFQVIT